MKKKIKYGDMFDSKMLEYYRNHIVDFVHDVIFHKDSIRRGGHLYLSEQQEDFLIKASKKRRVSRKSGRGIGKTFCAAALCIYWLCVYPSNTKFICTAPSFKTLKTALWNEILMWFDRSLVGPKYADLFELGAERICLKENRNGCYAEPRTAKDKESISGIHADNLLIIADEASGIDDIILDTLDATLTSGENNKLALISNPTKISGFFFDTFNKDRRRWDNGTYSSADSPFVDPEQVEYYKTKYGEEHPLYLINILGQFPPENADSFLSLHEISRAMEREVTPEGPIEIGVDVARFGDDLTVVYWRQGYKVYPPKTLAKSSIPETVGLVISTVLEIRELTGSTDKIRIKVDDTGIGGGVTDILNLDRQNNIEVLPCNFGGAGNETYHNEASAMWGNLRNILPLISLPEDEKLKEELAARSWKPSPTGKIMIQPKSEFKKAFGGSPDRADALILCFFNKEKQRVVLKEFDPLDKNIIKTHVGYAGAEKYCSIHISKTLFASICYLSWDGNRAYVYDEYCGDDPLILITTHIRQRMPFVKILGNDRMFSKDTESLEWKFRKFNINMFENYKYDELSAIETLSLYLSNKNIAIHESCGSTIKQLSRWKMDGSKFNQDIDFGLCYALSNAISFLQDKKKAVEQTYSNPMFGGIYQSQGPKVQNSWMLY
jgi:hypothetical protein